MSNSVSMSTNPGPSSQSLSTAPAAATLNFVFRNKRAGRGPYNHPAQWFSHFILAAETLLMKSDSEILHVEQFRADLVSLMWGFGARPAHLLLTPPLRLWPQTGPALHFIGKATVEPCVFIRVTRTVNGSTETGTRLLIFKFGKFSIALGILFWDTSPWNRSRSKILSLFIRQGQLAKVRN